MTELERRSLDALFRPRSVEAVDACARKGVRGVVVITAGFAEVGSYLESFGNPVRFMQIARRVSRTKPIVVVRSGRTEAGARAASSHTGLLCCLVGTSETPWSDGER